MHFKVRLRAPILQVILCQQSRGGGGGSGGGDSSSQSRAVMIDREWLECLLTSYYLFIEHFQGDPDIQVRFGQLSSNQIIM